jgi:hypothetical protein
MASVGHLTSQRVQPMHVLRMVCGTANPFCDEGQDFKTATSSSQAASLFYSLALKKEKALLKI